MNNKFDNWNIKKKFLNKNDKIPFFREWQVWFISMWENIWFEQNWKNGDFQRPVLISKKFNKDMFFWIPLTKTKREWKFYYELNIIDEFKSYAILSQLKMFSSKRLLSHIWWVDNTILELVKNKIKKLI